MKVQLLKGSQEPQYATVGSAGADVRHLGENTRILPGETKMFPTGIKMAVPLGYEIQVRPRSGLALKKSITVLNTPGTIDSDYRGDVGVILINHGHKEAYIESGERIAQLVLAKVEQAEWEYVDELESTDRGEGGFGHTGTH